MNNIEVKGLILAAGKGTRLRCLSFQSPKPMLPVGGKPVVQYSVEALRDSGVKNVFMNLHHKPDMIKEYFGDGSKFDMNIKYFVFHWERIC